MEKAINNHAPVVGVDFDDVVRDFIPAILEYYHHLTNRRFTKEDIYTYNLWEVWGCTKDESMQIVNDFYDSSFFSAIQPCPGAIAALHALAAFACPNIITAAAYKTKEQGENFLKTHATSIIVPVTYAASAYFPINGDNKHPKAEILQDIMAIAMVEDNPEFALACANSGTPVYLVRQPWNRSMPFHPSVTPVDSLEHAVENMLVRNP